MSKSVIAIIFATVFLLHTEARGASQAVQDWCKHLSAHLRSVNLEKCLKRPWIEGAESERKRPIPRFLWDGPQKTPISDDSSPDRVLIVGALHGDEITAVSTVFRWMELLEREPADSEIKKHSYLFIPLANPDGFYLDPRTRTNANGVDLNRNFETKEWKKDALRYWKVKAGNDPRRYPGKEAASEHETRLVQDWIKEFKPDLIISVHAPYKVVDHDGPIEFPNAHSPLPVRTLGAFPGSLGTYAGIERNIPVVTPELPNARIMPDQKSIEALFRFIMKAKY